MILRELTDGRKVFCGFAHLIRNGHQTVRALLGMKKHAWVFGLQFEVPLDDLRGAHMIEDRAIYYT